MAALRAPAAAIGSLMPQLKSHLLSYPRVHNVVKPDSCHPALSPPLHQSERLLLLRAEYAQRSAQSLPSEVVYSPTLHQSERLRLLSLLTRPFVRTQNANLVGSSLQCSKV